MLEDEGFGLLFLAIYVTRIIGASGIATARLINRAHDAGNQQKMKRSGGSPIGSRLSYPRSRSPSDGASRTSRELASRGSPREARPLRPAHPATTAHRGSRATDPIPAVTSLSYDGRARRDRPFSGLDPSPITVTAGVTV